MAAIIYINNKEHYGRNTASSQYFLQLARYLGIPVIAWNADNSGLDQEQVSVARQAGLVPRPNGFVLTFLLVLILVQANA